MSDQNYATVSGEKVHKSDFAYAPEGSEPSEWKLPIHDASHVRSALARFGQTQLPEAARAAALAKIHAAAKKFGIDAAPVKASEVRNGLVKLAIAYTGSFEKDGDEFKITPATLDEMRKNLAEREVPLDYEHLSGVVAPPGWSKAAGWIRRPAGIENLSDGREALFAWAEFTPAMLAMIKQKEYRYFSPEIRWNDTNEAGGKIGARLAAGAITNRPFLKDLPPIELSDADYQQLFGLAAREDGKLASVALSERGQSLVDVNQVHVPAAMGNVSVGYDQPNNKEKSMKKLTAKKLTEGEHAGHHGFFNEDGDAVGYMTEDALGNYADKNVGKKAEAKEKEDEKDKNKKELSEVALLSEVVSKEGSVNLTEVGRLADEGRVKPSFMLRIRDANDAVVQALKEGRIKPAAKADAIRLYLSDSAAFKAFVAEARPLADMAERGTAGPAAAGSGGYSALKAKVQEYAAAHKDKQGNPLRFDVALREYTKSGEGLQLWEQHQRELETIAAE